MERFNKLYEIKYSEVKPDGWLKDTLVEAKNGMPGNLHNIGYPFDTKCWEYKSLTDGGWSKQNRTDFAERICFQSIVKALR